MSLLSLVVSARARAVCAGAHPRQPLLQCCHMYGMEDGQLNVRGGKVAYLYDAELLDAVLVRYRTFGLAISCRKTKAGRTAIRPLSKARVYPSVS